MKYYAVFDTNVLVSSLLTKRRDSPTALVVDAISDGIIVPLYNSEILSEYEDVLHRDKFPFSSHSIHNILNVIRQFGRTVHTETIWPEEQDMLDSGDVVFFRVVMEKQDEEAWLITGNQRHFPRKPFIVTPAEMMAIIRGGSGNQTDFKVRRTMLEDLPAAMEIYAKARRFMAEHGNPNQWGPTNWPPEDLIRRDIQARKSYVCESGGHIAAVFYYDFGKDVEPNYAEITDGQWLDSAPYGVVHRIASDGTVKGTGSFCIQWAFEQCGHLRMDTHGDNKVMQSLLTKLGFLHCGTVYVEEDNYPRMAYEKTNNLKRGAAKWDG